MYDQLKREVIADVDDDWSVDVYGNLRCPCGQIVEDDGECPEGHVSPLREHALI